MASPKRKSGTIAGATGARPRSAAAGTRQPGVARPNAAAARIDGCAAEEQAPVAVRSTVSEKGRGSVINPTVRFESLSLEVLGEHVDEVLGENPDGTTCRTLVYRDGAKSVINPVDSPDLAMSWTLNPYRGCEHGCAYCYARPGHEYLGMSCGLDFETKIVAKFDAAALLEKELLRPSWKGEPIVMSGVTDPYQPVERTLGITRGCVEVFARLGHPVGIITKSALVLRDIDLLAGLARGNLARVTISITTLDAGLSAEMEPRAASPARRLETVRRLAEAGVPVSVMTAPIIPGLNDAEMPAILEAATAAGATSAGWALLRLPHQLKDVFLDWLRRRLPLRAGKVESLIRSTRGGELYDSTYFERRRGTGPVAENIRAMFHVFAARHGLDKPMPAMAHWRRPTLFLGDRQGDSKPLPARARTRLAPGGGALGGGGTEKPVRGENGTQLGLFG